MFCSTFYDICFNSFTLSKSGALKFFSTSQASWDMQLNADLAPFSSVTSAENGMRTSNMPFEGDQRRMSKPNRSTHISFASETCQNKMRHQRPPNERRIFSNNLQIWPYHNNNIRMFSESSRPNKCRQKSPQPS